MGNFFFVQITISEQLRSYLFPMLKTPNLGLLLSFLCLVIVCQAYVGIAQTTIQFSGTTTSCSSSCNSTQKASSLACNSDTVSWDDGTRNFMDPVKPGFSVESINVTLNVNIGCVNSTTNEGMVTIDRTLVGPVPQIIGKFNTITSYTNSIYLLRIIRII